MSYGPYTASGVCWYFIRTLHYRCTGTVVACIGAGFVGLLIANQLSSLQICTLNAKGGAMKGLFYTLSRLLSPLSHRPVMSITMIFD